MSEFLAERDDVDRRQRITDESDGVSDESIPETHFRWGGAGRPSNRWGTRLPSTAQSPSTSSAHRCQISAKYWLGSIEDSHAAKPTADRAWLSSTSEDRRAIAIAYPPLSNSPLN